VNLANRIENFEQMNQNGDKRQAEIQDQLDGTHESIQDTREELENITAELQDLQEKIQNIEAEFRVVEQAFNEATLQYNNQNIAYTRQHSKLDSLKQELTFRTNQLNDLKRQIAS
jgi:chromosome segregation protein